MNPIETLGLALGAGFSSGLNLYATIATLGLLQRFGVIHLPEQLQVLGHPWVLGIAIGLYVVEFLADKIPLVDTVWDAIHTVIRSPAAALLAYGAAGAAPPEWRWGAALLAGGVALTSHGSKASVRAAANTSPEPFSNWALSLGEDALASCGDDRCRRDPACVGGVCNLSPVSVFAARCAAIAGSLISKRNPTRKL
jgi:hypothetical protein